jgi:hypothetical protein
MYCIPRATQKGENNARMPHERKEIVKLSLRICFISLFYVWVIEILTNKSDIYCLLPLEAAFKPWQGKNTTASKISFYLKGSEVIKRFLRIFMHP